LCLSGFKFVAIILLKPERVNIYPQSSGRILCWIILKE
jgi:hypothetical protein